jgi:hypothetical protein
MRPLGENDRALFLSSKFLVDFHLISACQPVAFIRHAGNGH